MPYAVATLLTWNIERRAPQSRRAGVIMGRIAAQRPDVVCLTEAFEGSTSALAGHEILDRGAAWSLDRRDGERLVALWSQTPWRDIRLGNAETATGGFISGVTDTPLGPVCVIGICAPHHAASRIGAAERARQWSEQIVFWSGLSKAVATRDRAVPTVVLGDFNQFAPRVWGSKAAHSAMLVALSDISLATVGPIDGVGEPSVDHIAHTREWVPQRVTGLSRFDGDGRALSDHFGVAARFARSVPE